MTMPFNDDQFRESMRIPDSLMRHVHFDATTPLGTEYPKTPLFAMAAGRDFGAASSWPFGKAVVGLQQTASPCQPSATAPRTPPIKKEPLRELEKLGMVANCKKPYSPEDDDLNDRLRQAADFLGEQKQSDLLDVEGHLVEIEELLENASQEEQVDHRLIDRVRVMVSMAKERMAGEDPMQLDKSSGQDQEEQVAHEEVGFSLPIRINVGELHSESREAAARGNLKGGQFPGRLRGGVNPGSGPGAAPNDASGFVEGSGGAGAERGGQEENDGNGDVPQIESADSNPPWNEKWHSAERATYDQGETIFAQHYVSAQMSTHLYRDEEGKRPKMPEAKTFPYKSQVKLPDVAQKMFENDNRLEEENTWSLDHLQFGEGYDPK